MSSVLRPARGHRVLVANRRRRLERPPRRLLDGRDKQPLVVREFLARFVWACGVRNRHEIVGAEPLLNELLRGRFGPLQVKRVGVQVIDHHDVDASLEGPLIGSDVGLDRLACEERTVVFFDRDVDQREIGDRLPLTVLGHLEVAFFQIANELPLRVRHDDIHFDVFDRALECRRLGSLGSLGSLGRLCGERRAWHERREREQPDECQPLVHQEPPVVQL